MRAQTTSSSSDNAFAIGSRNQAILEINPSSSIIKKLDDLRKANPEGDATEDMVMMLYETAALLGGYTIEDPGQFAKRVTKLMDGGIDSPIGASVEAEVV